MTTTTEPTYTKSIQYNRFTKDYDLFLDNELVGFARSHVEGETTLDELVAELLKPQPPTPAQIAAIGKQAKEAYDRGDKAEYVRLKEQYIRLDAAHKGISYEANRQEIQNRIDTRKAAA